jgi:hypothetical protein
LKRLKEGRKFVTGKRREGLGGTFEQGQAVQVVSRDGKDFISTRSDANQDVLEQVPVF